MNFHRKFLIEKLMNSNSVRIIEKLNPVQYLLVDYQTG